ncbi:hypothetical protein [Sporosarcina sp. UB5]|uniref:hypothetical protein n=1 Tax=Sporosarcina sp. UB5 TaxID=3047463 RepID=UPI003D7AC35D
MRWKLRISNEVGNRSFYRSGCFFIGEYWASGDKACLSGDKPRLSGDNSRLSGDKPFVSGDKVCLSGDKRLKVSDSVYLSEELGQVAALSLSKGCNKFTKKYLESFEYSNSVRNRGEMNCFIENFLEIIKDALREMLEGLSEKRELLAMAVDKIENDSNLLESGRKIFMFVLAQNHFFHFSQGVTVSELSDVMQLSKSTIRKIAKELLDLSLIEQKGIRPAIYSIKQEYFEN